MNGSFIKDRLLDTFSSLRHKNFRYFWFGQCISLIGTWMQRTAQAWLVYQITDSPFLLGLLGVFQFGPVMLFSVFAGVIADRFPKRKLILFTQVVFMAQAAILTILVMTGYVKYWHILVLATVYGFANTLDMPARQSFFIDLVGKDDLMNAISLNSAIVNLARIFGPLVAGVAMSTIGAGYCFLINTISFVAPFTGMYLIDKGNTAVSRAKGNVLRDIKQGISYIAENQILKETIIVLTLVCTFALNMEVIVPVFTKEALGGSEGVFSLLLAAQGLGSLLGALVMAQRSKKGLNRFIMYGNAFLLSMLLITSSFSTSLTVSLILAASIGFCALTFLNMGNSTLQLNASNEYRGRVMSFYTLVFLGSAPVGYFFTGVIMEHFSGRMGFLVCGVSTLALTLILVLLNINVKNRDFNI